MLLLKNLPSFIQKKFRVGSVSIIGKGVIQDFFTCAGALPSMGSSILHGTSSLADAIAMLVVELERQFMHMHPSIKGFFWIFLILSILLLSVLLLYFWLMSLDLP